MHSMDEKYREFWYLVEDRKPETREELIALAKSFGMSWGECADMSTRFDGAIRYFDGGKRAAFLRQIRNYVEPWK